MRESNPVSLGLDPILIPSCHFIFRLKLLIADETKRYKRAESLARNVCFLLLSILPLSLLAPGTPGGQH